MKDNVLSAGLWHFFGAAAAPVWEEERDEARPQQKIRTAGTWNADNFARAQIRGLVRQVFLSGSARQVVFTAVDPGTDVRSICRRAGEALALETPRSIAVLGGYLRVLQTTDAPHGQSAEQAREGRLRPLAIRLRENLWLVPDDAKDDPAPATSLHSYLGELRREFEYSIVQGPPAGESDEAAAMAQLADGVILVLTANQTRRIAARRIKESLAGAQARILGTVLCDRVFPIPETIYRRL